MVIINEKKLKHGISEAIKKAKSYNKPILYSEVQMIDNIDPLSFFQAGKDIYEGTRSFWRNTESNYYLVGIGTCYQLQTSYSDDRFFHVENEWKQLVDDAIISTDINESGIGPTMIGGFSFDPQKDKTNLWEKFGDVVITLPSFMLTVREDKTYLTINVLCTQLDDQSLVQRVEEKIEFLMNSLEAPILYQAEIIQKVETNPNGWKKSVQDVVDMLKDKIADKVVLARELKLQFDDKVSIESTINQLQNQQQTSYIFALESAGDCFVGATPERLAKLENHILKTACVAGSIPRGKTVEEDEVLGKELLNDKKNIIEHNFVVNMIKASMEQVCSEITIPSEMALLKTKHIQHLFTPIEGKIKEGRTFLPVIDLLHPTPALGGLPKEKAKEIIRDVEQLDRGLYGAPIGWMDFQGNGEFAVAIRSGLIQKDKVTLFAGCGVVEDSNPESEYLETGVKFNPMLSALGGTVE